MKEILLSIPPKQAEKIANNQLTILIRKTKPNTEGPFRCYIYCTKAKTKQERLMLQPFGYSLGDFESSLTYRADGKVIGEFVCNKIYKLPFSRAFADYEFTEIYNDNGVKNYFSLKKTCLTQNEIYEYGKGSPLYGWHISDLVIYDKPKELSEFYVAKPIPTEKQTESDDCVFCKYHRWIGSMKEYVEKGIPMREKCLLKKPEPICEYTPPLKRPPQSWCYVESLGE